MLVSLSARAEAPVVTPTFHSLGIAWRPDPPATTSERPTVRFRRVGTTAWRDADPLLFTYAAPDAAKVRAPEFRGSLLQVFSGTTYEIEITRGASTVTATASTWSEVPLIKKVVKIPSGAAPIDITEGGSEADGYVVYEGEPGAVIDVADQARACVTVEASFVIVRGLELLGASKVGIELVGDDIHDVIIERNEIAGWGGQDSDGFGHDLDAAVGAYKAGSVQRIVVQRNVIRDPRHDANSWLERRSYLESDGQTPCPPAYDASNTLIAGWSCHPEGPQGVVAMDPRGQLVIRYNHVYSANGNRFNDILGGGSNFSFQGFPGPDSDIYGNDLSDGWDDGIESEGGNQNVRIWDNRVQRSLTGVAVATVSLGPVYIFRNVRGDARGTDRYPDGSPMADDDPNMPYGPFVKTAPRKYRPSTNDLRQEYAFPSGDSAHTDEDEDAAGPIRVFHNTLLQPVSAAVPGYLVGSGTSMSSHQAVLRNVWTRNNVFFLHKATDSLLYQITPPAGGAWPADVRNDIDWDLSNTTKVPAAPAGSPATAFELNGLMNTTPTFDPNNAPDTYFLTAGSPGVDDGAVLPGLNDGYVGKAPDRGAFEVGAKALAFGPEADLNQPPVAVAKASDVVDEDGDGAQEVTLDGSGSTDPDGWVRSFAWREGTKLLGSSETVDVSLAVGAHTITLEVGDNVDGTASSTITVHVLPRGSAPDGGPGGSGGSEGGGGGSGSPKNDSGCGCRMAGEGGEGTTAAVLAIVAVLARRRRRPIEVTPRTRVRSSST